MKRITMLLWALVLSVAMMAMASAEEAHTHEYGPWQIKTPATCSSAGVEVRICPGCGDVEQREIPANENHSFGEWYTKEHPTCTSDGLEVRICAICGKVEGRALAGGHRFGSWNVKAPATCGVDGVEVRICEVCGNVESKTIPASGSHSFGDWAVREAATCAKAGREVRICATCGTVESRDIPRLPHTEETLPGKAATCTEAGLTEGKRCAVCGETIVAQEAIPATGHREETLPGKAATCTEAGLTEGKRCAVCGEITVAQKAIPATGHAYHTEKVAATATSRGYTLYTCAVCGDYFRDHFTSKLSAPTATAEPTAEAAWDSIVTDRNRDAAAYTSDAAQAGLLVITAESGELRNLHLSLALLAELKAEGIEEIRFVVGDAALTIPLSAFEQEDVALILADVGEDAAGYVITLDPAATTADGQPGCLAQAVIAAQDGQETDITPFLQGLALTLDGQQLDVTESAVYAYGAA